MKISVKLSKKNSPISQLLKKTHKLKNHIDDWGNIHGCEVYYGISFAGEPSWKGLLSSGASGTISGLNNQGAAAIVFVPIDDRYMIFSFGYGVHQLSGLGIERDFGLRVVLNTVDPDSIRSIDSKTHDTVVKVQRIQLSKEKRISEFGFEINKDLLKQIAGRPTNKSFASSINGGESLTMTSDLKAITIQRKVKEIYDAYGSKNYQTHYAWVDNIQSVKDPSIIDELERELEKAINDLLNSGDQDLQIACPEIVDFNAIDYYQIRGYRSRYRFPFIDIEGLLADLKAQGITSLSIKKIQSYQVNAKIGGTNTHHTWFLYDWIVFSPVLHGKQYILSEGDWFEVSADYNSAINKALD
jgi:uncharacterized protein (TIGR04141 family)